MNAIEKLKELETRALDGRQDINLQAIAEDVYADALRRVGPEIIAVMEAAERVVCPEPGQPTVCLLEIVGLTHAIQTFHAKAAEVLP